MITEQCVYVICLTATAPVRAAKMNHLLINQTWEFKSTLSAACFIHMHMWEKNYLFTHCNTILMLVCKGSGTYVLITFQITTFQCGVCFLIRRHIKTPPLSWLVGCSRATSVSLNLKITGRCRMNKERHELTLSLLLQFSGVCPDLSQLLLMVFTRLLKPRSIIPLSALIHSLKKKKKKTPYNANTQQRLFHLKRQTFQSYRLRVSL